MQEEKNVNSLPTVASAGPCLIAHNFSLSTQNALFSERMKASIFRLLERSPFIFLSACLPKQFVTTDLHFPRNQNK